MQKDFKYLRYTGVGVGIGEMQNAKCKISNMEIAGADLVSALKTSGNKRRCKGGQDAHPYCERI